MESIGKKMNSTGAQDWRAIALIAAGGERLLCLGESASQVRAAYAGAWIEVIRDEDRPTVKQISLQKWAGKVWQGQWEHQSYLTLPTGRGARVSHDGDIAIAEDLSAIDDELIIRIISESFRPKYQTFSIGSDSKRLAQTFRSGHFCWIKSAINSIDRRSLA